MYTVTDNIIQLSKTLLRWVTKRGTVTSFSQNGEDSVIHALLRHVESGVYVDVGAYNPILYSNTYLFYRMGWSGIVIDPNNLMRLQYRIVRSRDEFVNVGIGKKKDEKPYFMFSDGAYNTFDEREADMRRKYKNIHFLGKTNICIRPLCDIITEYGLSKIDFLNVDVEGLDLDVLKSHDWRIRPSVIAIEDHFFDPSEPTKSEAFCFLIKQDYILSGMANFTIIFKSKY